MLMYIKYFKLIMLNIECILNILYKLDVIYLFRLDKHDNFYKKL